ncbi:hypothetical protein Hanom_Chr11g01004151 [Helianthus anomalus]
MSWRRRIVETEAVDIGVTQPKSPEVVTRQSEKGKSVQDDPVITIPNSFAHNEEDSPIRPEETPVDYYYRSYLERKASEIHAPVWKLKKGDTFSD